MTTAEEVLRRAAAEDVELSRIVFVNSSGVPRGRVVDRETLADVLETGANVTHAMQSFNALDRLAPTGRYGPAGEVRIVPGPDTFTVLPYDDRAGLLLAELHDLHGDRGPPVPERVSGRISTNWRPRATNQRWGTRASSTTPSTTTARRSRSTTAPASRRRGCAPHTTWSSTRWTH